jgi:hypothetical protein
MRTNVEFRSDKFPAFPGEEERINPGRWGQALAQYLQVKLRECGISTKIEIGFEDWGCRLDLTGTPFPIWIGCGNYEEYPDGYLCFLEPSKPRIWRFPFKFIDTTFQMHRVADALNEILTTDPDIRDVRWWPEGKMWAEV